MLMAAAATVVAAPTHAPDDVASLVEVADISSLALSPDRRWLAVRVERPSIRGNRVRLSWFVLRLDRAGGVHRVADGGEAQFDGGGLLLEEAPTWSRDSRSILFRRTVAGDTQIWRARIDTRGSTRITGGHGNVARFVLADDGRTLSYLAGAGQRAIAAAERAARDNGVRVDDRIELAAGVVGGLRDNGRERSVRLGTGWFDRIGILDARPPRRVTIALADGRVIAVRRLDRWPPAPPGSTPSVERRCDPRGCRGILRAWRATADGVAVSAEIDITGATSIAVADGDRRETRTWRSEGLLAGSRNYWEPCVMASTIHCVAASALEPPRLVTIDPSTGRQAVAFDPNRPLRRAVHVVPHRVLTWRTPDGEVFGGHLLGGGTATPVVVHYYDCHGFLRGGLGDELPMIPLVRAGIAVLCINASYLPSTADKFGRYERGRLAVEAIVDTLARAGTVDRGRIGMHGLSFGSEVAMWIARHSTLLRAVSIASPQGDPAYYWLNAATGADFPARFRSSWGIGDPDADPAGWRRFSPARDVAAIRVPVLMQFAELEARQSAELYAKLRVADVPTEMYVYPGASHLKSQPAQRLRVYERNLDWFGYWLADRIDPKPGKRAQYARWSTLKARFAAHYPGQPGLGVDQ